MDSATINLIIGAVFGVLAAVLVLAVVFYYCIKKKQIENTDTIRPLTPYRKCVKSVGHVGVDASTLTKNMGATQTTVLEMDGILDCRSYQDSDNQNSSATTSKNNDKFGYESKPVTTSVRPVNIISKEMVPRTWSISALEVDIPENVEMNNFGSMKVDRKVDIPESIQISKLSNSTQFNANKLVTNDDSRTERSLLSTSNNSSVFHQQVVTTASVYKQPKGNSMSRTVLSNTMSFWRGNQDEGSFASDTYFHSSFSNLENMEENDIVTDKDELNSSSERLKRFLEKEADGFYVMEDERNKKSDNVLQTETFDSPLEVEKCKNDDNAAVLFPSLVQSESEQFSKIDISKENLNKTSSSSFDFQLAELSGVSKNKWRNASSSSEDSFPKDDLWDDECITELEWDNQHGTNSTPSFHITVSSQPFINERKDSQTSLFLANLEIARKSLKPLSARKSPQTSKKSSNSSFKSALSLNHTPFDQLMQNSCADYISAEEDISNISETIDSSFGQLQLRSDSSEDSFHM